MFLLTLIALLSYKADVKGSATNHRVIVGGATGYIGRNVVKQLVARGVTTAALVRSDPSELSDISLKYFQGAEIIQCDVLDPTSTDHSFLSFQPTAVICCLASRSGTKSSIIGRSFFTAGTQKQTYILAFYIISAPFDSFDNFCEDQLIRVDFLII